LCGGFHGWGVLLYLFFGGNLGTILKEVGLKNPIPFTTNILYRKKPSLMLEGLFKEENPRYFLRSHKEDICDLEGGFLGGLISLDMKGKKGGYRGRNSQKRLA